MNEQVTKLKEYNTSYNDVRQLCEVSRVEPNGKVYVRINVGTILKTPKEFSYSLVLNRSFTPIVKSSKQIRNSRSSSS